MGLDMYLTGEKCLTRNYKDPSKGETEDGLFVSAHHLEIGYWRKHADLHGFIVRTFAGGEDKCQKIYLDSKAIEAILTAARAHDYGGKTTGFFFGSSRGTDEEFDSDIKVFEAALAWAKGGKPGDEFRSVVYQASW